MVNFNVIFSINVFAIIIIKILFLFTKTHFCNYYFKNFTTLTIQMVTNELES